MNAINYYIAKAIYWSEWSNCYVYERVSDSVIEGWYKEARVVEKIKMSFEDFKYLCRREMGHLTWSEHRRTYRPRRACHSGTPRRKYQKKAHHKKKVLSDEEKDKRDRAKKRRTHKHKGVRWYHNSRGWLWYQVTANRKERRKVKQDIHRGDWDNWVTTRKRDFLDPWDYC